MTTYVTLYKITDQGMRTIKDSTRRLEAAKAAGAQAGVTVKEALWLQGEYDFMVILEASDEIAATAFQLSIAKLGNVRGQTMRAFPVAEMEKILAKVS
ncbi:MAG TPA: GYD domain-containing protein [Roseiarcus sp.]|nr:GYD domain-containing protein [Roseiarcus sp.]